MTDSDSYPPAPKSEDPEISGGATRGIHDSPLTETRDVSAFSVDGLTRIKDIDATAADFIDAPESDDSSDLKCVPKQIGRYQVIEMLGRGGFGSVYLAKDATLRRRVSIKVPHRHLIRSPAHLKRYMDEAMVVAQFEHPKIVPVYDVGQTDDGVCYIVSKYVESKTLTDKMLRGIEAQDAIEMIADLAETLQEVHEKGIVHRDIKPDNILVSEDGRLFINDFGLALIEVSNSERGKVVGTPAYMSPEQAHGESHLVDGRSDVFSLGVMLYEMLAGRRPFRGGKVEQVLYQIRKIDPKPLRQLNRNLPAALERVCQKALAKSVVARYASAIELAEDLRLVLQRWDDLCGRSSANARFAATDELSADNGNDDRNSTSDASAPSNSNSNVSTNPSEDEQAVVIPKGLRSYDQTDAAFFRSMLPGPYDIDGCPESILFWKHRIDPPNAMRSVAGGRSHRSHGVEPFRVGVIYGTSGCGKSSFIRAGLLPALDLSVTSCIVDAAAVGTLERVSSALARVTPTFEEIRDGGSDSNESIPLDQRMASIRRGENLPSGSKVLIVIDQFEQWLNAANSQQWATMVRALRQCDGHRLQVVLLVRDDFWLATSRLMRELDIELSASHNLAMIDLLDKSHAEKLLRMLGRAFECVGVGGERIRREERQFIQEAVTHLATGDRVVAVQLALFAEMMKTRPWTRATLRRLSGIDRIVEQFLYESFDSPQSPRSQNQHSRAVRAALAAMLPESGLIRGSAIPIDMLERATGYPADSESMTDLLRVLDQKLKLITPVQGNAAEILSGTGDLEDSASLAVPVHQFQLTHDSLVPAIRRWVQDHQNATFVGRAKRGMNQRSQAWSLGKEDRQLPSFFEYLWFALMIRPGQRGHADQAMMSAAARRHVRTAVVATTLGAVALFGWRHFSNQALVNRLASRLVIATTAELPNMLQEIDAHQSIVSNRLQEMVQSSEQPARSRFLAALALPSSLAAPEEVVVASLLSAPLDLLRIVRERRPQWIRTHRGSLLDVIANEDGNADERLRAGLLLAGAAENTVSEDGASYSTRPNDLVLSSQVIGKHSGFLSNAIVDESLSNKLAYADLTDLAIPIRELLIDGLTDIARTSPRITGRDAATTLIKDLHQDNPVGLLVAMMGLPDEAFESLKQGVDWSAVDTQEFDRRIDLIAARDSKDQRWMARTQATRIRLALEMARQPDGAQAEGIVQQTLQSADAQSSESLFDALLLDAMDQLAIDSRVFLYPSFESAVRRRCMQMFAIGDRLPDLSRGGAGLALTTEQEGLASQARRLARKRLQLGNDPAEFSAAFWLLARLGDREWVDEHLGGQIVGASDVLPSDDAAIRVNELGMPMALFPAKSISAVGYKDAAGEALFPDEPLDYGFEVAIDEVTIKNYLAFNEYYANTPELSCDHPDCPVGVIPWEQAVEFCQWLGRKEGLSEKDMAYEKAEDGTSRLRSDFQDRAGYRLPTSREWNAIWQADPARVACASDESLAKRYARLMPHADARSEPIGGVRPDRHGLFHLAANHEEWCSDRLRHMRAIRGIHFNWGSDETTKIDEVHWAPAVLNWVRIGFRVARSAVVCAARTDGDPSVTVQAPRE